MQNNPYSKQSTSMQAGASVQQTGVVTNPMSKKKYPQDQLPTSDIIDKENGGLVLEGKAVINSPRIEPNKLNTQRYLSLPNCSQTKFAAIALDLWSFHSIFRWTDFSSNPFDFSDLFRVCPQYVMHPLLQSMCHYIVNNYVKISHMRLGVQIICVWG